MDARRAKFRAVLLSLSLLMGSCIPRLLLAAEDLDKVLVTVNGAKITAGDLEFAFLSRRVPEAERAAAREKLLDQLIDRRLMAEFLASRSAKPADEDVQAEVDYIQTQIRKAGDDPVKVLAKLGFTEARLRDEVALPLAWKIHARRAITDGQLREHWEAHREELDGTQVRASQIFLKASSDKPEKLRQAEDLLRELRSEIVSGRMTFAEAAGRHSQSPSGKAGGDVGFFPFRGRMPPQFADAAFPLKPGEVSEPFRTPFGVHIVTVTDRKPGDLSLEDVRLRVFERLHQDLWNEIVRGLRSKARIERAP